ncbi:hypothetical protein EE765_14195, partial [Listeria monocytogenes]|nr:hypothetical protein [Listeria monocytogenes]
SAAKDTASGSAGSTGGTGSIASSESPSTPSSGGITSLGSSGGESNLPSDSPIATHSPGAAQQVENSNKNFATRPPGNNTEGLLKGHKSPQKEPPSVAYGTMPKGAASARENMLQYASGREKDPQSIPEKALSTYANTAQKAYDSNIAKKTRKSYDVMKNTTKGGQS